MSISPPHQSEFNDFPQVDMLSLHNAQLARSRWQPGRRGGKRYRVRGMENCLVEMLYVSPQNPRYLMLTEEQVQAACDDGIITESHYLDVKRELPTSKSNKELARDLASFAIDGGTLIVGVEEDKATSTFSLVPQSLNGVSERIEQIARSIPDPPLTVITRTIPSSSDPGSGFIIVHVPPSPTAPHMVDHKYLGRGDKTKHYLSNAEVSRLHDRRIASELDGIKLLDAEFARDPIPADERRQAHLFLLAEPLTPRPEMLLALTSGTGWQGRLSAFTRKAQGTEVEAALTGLRFNPDLSYASQPARRAHGAALTDGRLHADRTFKKEKDYGEDVVELEIGEDGGIRIFMSRMSDGRNGEQVLLDVAAVIFTRRLLALIHAAADKAGYFGNWIIAAGITGLRGVSAYSKKSEFYSSAEDPRFTDETYRRSTTTTYAEFSADPGRTAERLIGRLLRAVGVEDKYPAAKAAPATRQPPHHTASASNQPT